MSIMRLRIDRRRPERLAECQRSVEDGIINVTGDAQEAGWDRGEVLWAMVEVAENMGLAPGGNILHPVETEIACYESAKNSDN